MDAKCAWPAFHRQRSFLINEGQKAWNFYHTPWTRAAVMFMTVPLFFSLPPLNAPRPLSGFDTHPRWLPVTQSDRSRPSYGKIGDCEQSRVLHFWNYFVVEALASCYRFSVGEKHGSRYSLYLAKGKCVSSHANDNSFNSVYSCSVCSPKDAISCPGLLRFKTLSEEQCKISCFKCSR